MKTRFPLLATALVIALVLLCIGAVDIQWYSQQPNLGAIQDTDIGVFERQSPHAYGSFSGAQLKAFIGAASSGVISNFISTNIFQTFNVTTSINQTVITTNIYSSNAFFTNLVSNFITVNAPGGFTNLNLQPNAAMRTDSNDAEASISNAPGVLFNDGSGGPSGINWETNIVLNEVDTTILIVTNPPFLDLVNSTNLSGTNVDIDFQGQAATNGHQVVFSLDGGNFTNINHLSQSLSNYIAGLGTNSGVLFNAGWTNDSAGIHTVDTNKNVGIGISAPTHTLHISTTNNDAVGIDSTGTDSDSMIHVMNVGVQGPFMDFHGANGRWAWGVSSLGYFALRGYDPAVDPVNSSTFMLFNTNKNVEFAGELAAQGMSNLVFAASGYVTNDDKGGFHTTPTLPSGALPTDIAYVDKNNVFVNTSSNFNDNAVWTDATNANNTTPDFAIRTSTLSTNASFTWLLPTHLDTSGKVEQWIKTSVTNSSGTLITMTAPAGCHVCGAGANNVTNWTEILWQYYPPSGPTNYWPIPGY